METIKSKADISDLFSSGKRLRTPYLTLIVLPAKQHGLYGRVAFIAGKKAICRELGGPFPNLDVIFLAKSGICRAKYSKVLETCDEALKRAGIR